MVASFRRRKSRKSCPASFIWPNTWGPRTCLHGSFPSPLAPTHALKSPNKTSKSSDGMSFRACWRSSKKFSFVSWLALKVDAWEDRKCKNLFPAASVALMILDPQVFHCSPPNFHASKAGPLNTIATPSPLCLLWLSLEVGCPAANTMLLLTW